MTDIQRPPRAEVTDRRNVNYTPDQLNAELAATRQADTLISQMGAPTILDKGFVVWQGIWEGLDDTPEHHTGYDCSLRRSIYASVAKNSPNIGGRYFDKVWAFPWIKAPQVYQGMPQNTFEKQDGESIFSRVVGWATGRKKQEQA